MPPTIRSGRWEWFNIAHDLDIQGKLPGVIMDPLNASVHSCGGVTNDGCRFWISWLLGTSLILSFTVDNLALVEAFAKVLRYRPFCKYDTSNFILSKAYEWGASSDYRIRRFRELGERSDVTSLIRL